MLNITLCIKYAFTHKFSNYEGHVQKHCNTNRKYTYLAGISKPVACYWHKASYFTMAFMKCHMASAIYLLIYLSISDPLLIDLLISLSICLSFFLSIHPSIHPPYKHNQLFTTMNVTLKGYKFRDHSIWTHRQYTINIVTLLSLIELCLLEKCWSFTHPTFIT